MNLNEKSPKLKVYSSIILLIAVLLSFNQCVVKNLGKKTNTSSSLGVSAPAPGDSDTPDIDAEKELPDNLTLPAMNLPESEIVDVGIKNFEQINQTMSDLTGVSTTETNVARVYTEVEYQLPNDNNIKTFLPSHQVAITKLAAEYCHVLMENATLRSRIWPNLNFSDTPVRVFTTTNKGTIVDTTLLHFLKGEEGDQAVTLNTSTTTTTPSTVSSVQAFTQTVYTVTRARCISCHRNSVNPFHASDSAQTAHDALISTAKVDLVTPANSRMVLKLKVDRHNCWSDCNANATEMQNQIQQWKTLIAPTTSTTSTQMIQTSLKNEFLTLLDSLLVGEDVNNSANTRKIMKGLCIGALANAQNMML